MKIKYICIFILSVLLSIIAIRIGAAHFTFGVNESDSLPQKLFIIMKGASKFERDDYVVFRKHS